MIKDKHIPENFNKKWMLVECDVWVDILLEVLINELSLSGIRKIDNNDYF